MNLLKSLENCERREKIEQELLAVQPHPLPLLRPVSTMDMEANSALSSVPQRPTSCHHLSRLTSPRSSLVSLWTLERVCLKAYVVP